MTQVAVGILYLDDKILICQRKKGLRYELKWEFPGGKLEPGETIEQCLHRELFEELGIDIRAIEYIEMQSAYYEDGGLYNIAYCFVSGFNGTPSNKVFEQIRWTTISQLKETDMLEGNKPFVEKLSNKTTNHHSKEHYIPK